MYWRNIVKFCTRADKTLRQSEAGQTRINRNEADERPRCSHTAFHFLETESVSRLVFCSWYKWARAFVFQEILRIDMCLGWNFVHQSPGISHLSVERGVRGCATNPHPGTSNNHSSAEPKKSLEIFYLPSILDNGLLGSTSAVRSCDSKEGESNSRKLIS